MKCVSCLHHDIELQKVDTVCALHVDAIDKERERFCMSSPKKGGTERTTDEAQTQREREREREPLWAWWTAEAANQSDAFIVIAWLTNMIPKVQDRKQNPMLVKRLVAGTRGELCNWQRTIFFLNGCYVLLRRWVWHWYNWYNHIIYCTYIESAWTCPGSKNISISISLPGPSTSHGGRRWRRLRFGQWRFWRWFWLRRFARRGTSDDVSVEHVTFDIWKCLCGIVMFCVSSKNCANTNQPHAT